MRASVIIPSYNGKDKLTNLLQSLEKQSVSDIEIIVVIDGSTDGTLQWIQSRNWNLNALRLIEQNNKGRAAARNTGAKEATANLLIFFDDDMIVEASCIQKHITFHSAKHTDCISMGLVTEPAAKDDIEIIQYKDYLNTLWNTSLMQYSQTELPEDLIILSAANFSISKNIFFELRGFDEILKDIEDYDFALRAKLAGIKTCFLNDAVAVHNDSFTFKKYADRSISYLKNRKLAATIKPDLYAKDPILTHKDSTVQKVVYSFFKFPFWIYMLDRLNIMPFILPKRIRYTLYGIVLTGYIKNQYLLKKAPGVIYFTIYSFFKLLLT